MNESIKNALDLHELLVGSAFTAMAWLLILKFELHYLTLEYFKKLAGYLGLSRIEGASLEVCALCLTFWISLTIFLVTGEGNAITLWSHSILKALFVVPFVLKLIENQLYGRD